MPPAAIRTFPSIPPNTTLRQGVPRVTMIVTMDPVFTTK